MVRAFIGIGSNVGDRQAQAERALTHLSQHPQIEILKISRWHETKAVCLPGETQPDFINGAVQIETALMPEALHRTLKQIELRMGREPRPKKWRPRLIDLDLLFYGDQIVETPALKIPHPHAHERLFVLEPLAEIAPDFVHPVLKKAVAKLYRDMLERPQ
ncbi:MAG: 2-amino-4-hydroxy-6-hydroxymethyldihydropteridine diphosphokinase [Deltaproteobacteria bacterium]|nr:2-amino-4-hydroxy-6-hydroxymethyldihydropteridine diphosphokinase [Deltaproteobacteria bacterium]